jgi:hypothetical protein
VVQCCDHGKESSAPKRDREFFTSYANIGFSRMILFSGTRCEDQNVVCAKKGCDWLIKSLITRATLVIKRKVFI